MTTAEITLPDYRYCNTADLTRLHQHAEIDKRNRTGLTRAGLRMLDPDGVHVLNMRLYGHNLDANPDDLHHRIEVLAKVYDTTVPTTFLLDVSDRDWKCLHKVGVVLSPPTADQPVVPQ